MLKRTLFWKGFVLLSVGIVASACEDDPLPCIVTHEQLVLGDSANLHYVNHGTGIELEAAPNESNAWSFDLDEDGITDVSFHASSYSSQSGSHSSYVWVEWQTSSTSLLTALKIDTTVRFWITPPGFGTALSHLASGSVIPAEADSGIVRPRMNRIPAMLPIGTMSWDVNILDFRDSSHVFLSMSLYSPSPFSPFPVTQIQFEAFDVNDDGYFLIKKEKPCGTIWAWFRVKRGESGYLLMSYAYSEVLGGAN